MTLLATAAVLLSMSFTPALANRGPGTLGSFGGSWSISYFETTAGVCNSTPWPTYFADGVGIGGPGISPVVGTSDNICVQVSATGDITDEGLTVFYQIPGIVGGTLLFTMSSGGSGSGTIVVAGSSLDSIGLCLTAPEKISVDGASNSGPTADHLIRAGPDCTPTTSGVPEFPLGIALLFAATVPALLLLRSRINSLKK